MIPRLRCRRLVERADVVPEMSASSAREEIPIYVLESGQLFDPNALSLKEFIDPVLSADGDAVHELVLSDGTVVKTRLEPRLRRFPSSIRYDTRGLELFDELTMLEDEYYLTACERSLLKTHMDAIAAHIPDGAAIVELGCGSMKKTAFILDHLRRVALRKNLRFYGLDIDSTYLLQSLQNLKDQEAEKNVPAEHAIAYAGIHGTYEKLVSFLPRISGPRFFLWLGSTVGSMTREEAADLLRLYAHAMGPEDGFILASDRRNDAKTISRAYNDSKGIIAKLGMNTLVCLNRLLGRTVFDIDRFDRWSAYNPAAGRNEAYIRSLVDQTVTIPAPHSGKEEDIEVHLKRDELIHYLYSFKYSLEDLKSLTAASGMFLADFWTDPKDMYCVSLLKRTDAEE